MINKQSERRGSNYICKAQRTVDPDNIQHQDVSPKHKIYTKKGIDRRVPDTHTSQ